MVLLAATLWVLLSRNKLDLRVATCYHCTRIYRCRHACPGFLVSKCLVYHWPGGHKALHNPCTFNVCSFFKCFLLSHRINRGFRVECQQDTQSRGAFSCLLAVKEAGTRDSCSIGLQCDFPTFAGANCGKHQRCAHVHQPKPELVGSGIKSWSLTTTDHSQKCSKSKPMHKEISNT